MKRVSGWWVLPVSVWVAGAVLPAQVARADGLARSNRLAVSVLGFGLGSASMGSFESFSNDGSRALERVNPGLKVNGAPSSNVQVNAEISVRYYFDYHVLAQLGYGAIYNWSSADYAFGSATGSVEYHNVVMELPILVGGYHTLLDRLYLYGAVGPNVFFFPRSYWDAEPSRSGLTDYKADGGVGFTGLAGADMVLAENFGVGFELRYRYLKAGELKTLKEGAVFTPSMLGAGSSSEPYELDFSGISFGVYLRLFAM